MRWLAIILFVVAIGCGTSIPMAVVMVNPETGKSVYITHYSYGYGAGGLSAAVAAKQQQYRAIQAARMMGYTQMKVVE